ncbi:MAG TPA: phosphatase [Candidatus Acidoferrum sp.]|nr:phosphatase [Candidatus Acidoferrum sp.]
MRKEERKTKIIADLHTHTLASGHAYSTLKENLDQAREAGLLYYGVSDHTPGMRGTTIPGYFYNLKVLGGTIGGVRLLKGAEANILDDKGTIDVPERAIDSLDYVIASLHDIVVEDMGIARNTAAVIGAMENPYVKIIGHPDDSRYPLNYGELALAAKRTGTALELNNSSLSPNTSRKGGWQNATQMLKACKAIGARIMVGSDSHVFYDVGNFIHAQELIEICEFPQELVINANAVTFEEFMLEKKPLSAQSEIAV